MNLHPFPAMIFLCLLAVARPAKSRGQGVIADHTCTDLARIPSAAITQAKAVLRVGYGHTSHGSQLVTGLTTLAARLGPPYDYAASSWGLRPGVFLNDYWGNAGGAGDLGSAGDLAWRDATIDMLAQPGNDRNVVIWSWCGGVSGNTAAGIETYLQAMNELEEAYPSVRFVYMTGHLDGSGTDGNLNRMNTLIRQYCRTHNKILFDFADIESYDPDGNEFLSRNADDGCNYSDGNWADEWTAAHPGDPLGTDCSCAHSKALNCNLKGRAFWWLLARLAGWPGPDPGLPAPAGVHASDGVFSNAVQVAWQPAAGAAAYEVWRAPLAGSPARLATAADTLYTDSGVMPGDIHTYWIRATAGSTASAFSASDNGYAGRLAATQTLAADFDGDRKADPVIYNESGGTWHVWLSAAGYARFDTAGKGGLGRQAAAADFDGDRLADWAVMNEGLWTLWLSGAGYAPLGPVACGTPASRPAPADYDGDGFADPAAFDAGLWTARVSGAGYRSLGPRAFGAAGSCPAPADYDGDGFADPAVFEAGHWTAWLSGSGYRPLGSLSFGAAGNCPAPADFDGDGFADPAVFQSGPGTWAALLSSLGYGRVGPLRLR